METIVLKLWKVSWHGNHGTESEYIAACSLQQLMLILGDRNISNIAKEGNVYVPKEP